MCDPRFGTRRLADAAMLRPNGIRLSAPRDQRRWGLQPLRNNLSPTPPSSTQTTLHYSHRHCNEERSRWNTANWGERDTAYRR
jgi:hypothetical protein